jgi:hypothetical protein
MQIIYITQEFFFSDALHVATRHLIIIHNSEVSPPLPSPCDCGGRHHHHPYHHHLLVYPEFSVYFVFNTVC